LLIGRASQANVARVDDVVPASHELVGGTTGEALIEQELQCSAGRRELNDAIVQQRFCVGEGLPKVLLFELGVLAKQIDACGVCPKSFEHAPHCDA
jgi:hypothetical protein